MTKKYLSKNIITINDNLRIYQYFYEYGVLIYYVPKSTEDKVISQLVQYPINVVNNAYVYDSDKFKKDE